MPVFRFRQSLAAATFAMALAVLVPHLSRPGSGADAKLWAFQPHLWAFHCDCPSSRLKCL